jgi:hypothetical protein
MTRYLMLLIAIPVFVFAADPTEPKSRCECGQGLSSQCDEAYEEAFRKPSPVPDSHASAFYL